MVTKIYENRENAEKKLSLKDTDVKEERTKEKKLSLLEDGLDF